MADHKPELPFRIVPPPRLPARGVITPTEIVAVLLSLGWMAVVTLFLTFEGLGGQGFDSLRFVVTLLAIFMPVAMIWVAATSSKSARIMREESQRLQAAIDGIRQTYVAQQQSLNSGNRPAVERKLEEIAAAQRKTETALATFVSVRQPQSDEPRPLMRPEQLPDTDDEPLLALGTPAEAPTQPVTTPEFIRALNFPENTEDHDGFRALRRALGDRKLAQVIQASQDVLTLLSQDGIYMDDLSPDLARPEVWRRFARGERGRAVSGLGGIRDRSSLALSAGRMRSDTIFRDAVHHFLRKFDRMLAELEPSVTDAEIVELSDTRTARAFMLLGRVTGTFD